MGLFMDYHGLNAVCIKNSYTLPIMKDMLADLAKGKVFTKLCLREAYYCMKIKAGMSEKWFSIGL